MKRLLTLALAAALVLVLAVTASAATETVQATLHYKDIKIMLDGREVETPYEPFIIDGTTYLPVRAVSAALGLSVDWDGEKNSVILTSAEVAEHASVYITRTGSKYHYDGQCNGGTYWLVPMETALGFGLEPCDKCVMTVAHPNG